MHAEQPAQAFAYYLPQYYPVPLNSKWWGEGYTEWTAVLRAQRGLRSPGWAVLTPGELGFYDLRLPETRRRQGALASQYGLSAFCVYHYYSDGHRPMPTVVDYMLEDGEPDFPFFFCWANHDWTLAWDDRPDIQIHKQNYSEHQHDNHFEWLLEAFRDSRYFTIGGCPVLAIYAPRDIPEHRRIFAHWRALARTAGFPGLVLLGVRHGVTAPDARSEGLDAWVESPGASVADLSASKRVRRTIRSPMSLWRLLRYGDYEVKLSELEDLVRGQRNRQPGPLVPTVIASWNNAGRRPRRAWYFRARPEFFREQLATAAATAPTLGDSSPVRLVCINAWNEWGELMAVEPSIEFGRDMLEQIGNVFRPPSRRIDIRTRGSVT